MQFIIIPRWKSHIDNSPHPQPNQTSHFPWYLIIYHSTDQPRSTKKEGKRGRGMHNIPKTEEKSGALNGWSEAIFETRTPGLHPA